MCPPRLSARAFAELAVFAEVMGRRRRAPSLRQLLVYGGATRQQRSAGTVLPWSSIDRYKWSTAI